MDFDELSTEAQEKIHLVLFRGAVEEEDEKRRICTNFGYSRGGMPVMAWWMSLTLIAAVVLAMALVFYAPHHNGSMVESSLIGVPFMPLGLLPVIPFIFLKMRYALKALIIMIGVVVALGVIVALMQRAMFALV